MDYDNSFIHAELPAFVSDAVPAVRLDFDLHNPRPQLTPDIPGCLGYTVRGHRERSGIQCDTGVG